MRKPLALAAVSFLALGACSDSSTTQPPGSTTTTQPTSAPVEMSARIAAIRQRAASGSIVFASLLRPVGNCDALLAHIHAEAAARVGPYGLPGLGRALLEGDMANAAGASARESSDAAAAPNAANGQGGGDSYSTTNNQEAGVDEPDIVKTDGRRIVAITNDRLSVVAVDGTSASRPRTLRLGGANWAPGELLVHGDRALVFGTSWVPDTASSNDTAETARIAAGTTRATVTEVDLSGTGSPVVRRTLEIDGGYLTGRMVGSVARVVVRSEPQQLEFVTPQNRAGEDRARRSNEQVVLESTIEDWLPGYTLRDSGGAVVDSGQLTDCERVDAPSEFAGFGSLSVLTFDLAQPLGDGDAVSILAGGDTVYASETNLYVATQTWVDPEQQTTTSRWSNDFATSIHQFGIEGAGRATYVASGTVPGHLLNQFSMSEHDGVLRAATTKGVPWNADGSSVSLLTTLRRSGDQLQQVGQVGDMGKGERIYSVRYAGDVAYLVTFRQTDPFYTVDLSDPAAPKVVGELKITGYSGYLHPIADDLVIGVGQEATDQGRVQGTKVSLFDVSDLAHPAELAKWVLTGSSSGAEFDHKAFLWWPTTKTLVLPLTQWNRSPMPVPVPAEGGRTSGSTGSSAPSIAPAYDQGFYGAVVLKVDRATGITEQGRISHRIEKPADLGATDCRVVPASEASKGAEANGVTLPDEALVIVCGSGATGGAVGYSCNRMYQADLEQVAPKATVVIPDGGWIEWCWPSWNQPNPIQRSLVVGPALWTMSQQHLQANDLATLAQGAKVSL